MMHQEVFAMEYALEVITQKLKSTGMNQIEIDHLLAQFLQEEAFEYVDYINSVLTDFDFEDIASGLMC